MITKEQIEEYLRNCKRNIRQHPERNEHFIECDPVILISIIQELQQLRTYRDTMVNFNGPTIESADAILTHFGKDGELKGSGDWRLREIEKHARLIAENADLIASDPPIPGETT